MSQGKQLAVNLKRVFLISLLISLAAGAVVGVIGILSPGWRLQFQLVWTMMSIGLFSLTLLGTAIVLDKRQWRGAMFVSLGVSTLGLFYYVLVIWLGNELDYLIRATLRQLMVDFAMAAVAIPLAGLLSLTRFRHPVLRFIRVISIALVLVTGAVFALAVWGNPQEDTWKFIGIITILSVLCVIALPLLHKLAGLPPPGETVQQETEIHLRCPRCSLDQKLRSGHARCARCKLRINIEVEEPRCPKCNYLLYQLTEPRCPECGEALGADEVVNATSEHAPSA